MPPKKPKPKAEGETDPFDEFIKKYDKMQREFETEKIAKMQEIRRLRDEGEDVKCWNFDEKFDPMSFRVLFQSLKQSQFLEIEGIRLWQCGGGDESVRSVCLYLECDPMVKDLHFTDNGLSPLGCEFLGKTLGPTGNKIVNLLRLDYNQFGTAGVEKLSDGLSQNATLRQLSLQYCAIGPEGGEFLARILTFCKSALEVLELRGNYLGNMGILDVFHGARRAKVLQSIDVFDNKFEDSPQLVSVLKELFANNKTITNYDLGGNQISEQAAEQLVRGMIGNAHLVSVKVPERVPSKTVEAIQIQLQASKGKKKKKGKK
jgi:Ran GTPase-activating protein (RanGAP) involved in mRNA processing and transport